MLGADSRYVLVYSDEDAHHLEASNPYMPSDLQIAMGAPLLTPRVDMPADVLEKAIRFQRLKYPVRFVCAVDVFISIYYFYMSWLFGALFTVVSVNGFLATVYHRKSLMLCYVGYQYSQIGGRLANLGYYIYLISYAPPHNTTHANSTQLINFHTSTAHNNQPLQVATLSVLLLMQMCIASAVTQFYMLLPCDADRDRVTYGVGI